MVDGYLDFARGEGREGIVPVDLGSLLREVAERVGRERARIEVELEQPITAAAAPDRDAALPVEPDRQRGRARRAGSASGPPQQGDQIWIAIDDDGPGIPEDQREAVFKPFYRLDPSRNPGTGGVGLGLTIARDIVLGHGGDIELADAPRGGLRVLVRLPR